MSKQNTSAIFDNASKIVNGWDEAVYDTEAKIQETELRLKKLKSVLAVFKERRDNNEPFPGEAKSDVAQK
jgi:hypothetical protein